MRRRKITESVQDSPAKTIPQSLLKADLSMGLGLGQEKTRTSGGSKSWGTSWAWFSVNGFPACALFSMIVSREPNFFHISCSIQGNIF